MTTKAAHYIQLLDNARCEGDWSAVPELVRKVRKHAPERSCLALTAETECAISRVTAANPTPGGQSSVRPTTSANSKSPDVATQLPKLLTAMEEERVYPEDRFQAQVCIGWLHWVVAEYSLAAVRLPKSLDQEETQLDPAHALSEWTTVCSLKAAYIKADCLIRSYQRIEALAALHTGLPSLARVWSGHGIRKQLRYWSELFLTEFCMLSSQALQDNELSLEDPNSLACFRTWARYWEVMSGPVAGGYGFKGSVPRRKIWSEYYVVLSRILERDLPVPGGYVSKTTSDLSPRGRLRAELKSTEVAYQALLLGETSFPRADEERAEVEAFVRLVVKNWSVLCGRGWREQDLGQGGRSSLSRGILDTLYSAATRTYHSTAILRSLFTVHLSVAEFSQALKAFDSYLELVKKGKARIEKTGHPEPSLDDDGTVLETMAQCVIALCRFGHRKEAERARQLGAELEDRLSKLPQLRTIENGTPLATQPEEEIELRSPVPPDVVALVWQAIGLAHAHWSRVTHEAASRTEIQQKAIRCLRRSLATESGRSKDIRSFFALGLLLAERRELTGAIELVRAALLTHKGQDESYNVLHGPYWQERSLIPMWHLLALLLSARQDYAMAAKACEGALEQFKDPAVLFGKADPAFRSEHLNEVEPKGDDAENQAGLVDEMDDSEKESLLEVKMTQLALIELIDGADVAVNASYELLTLFSRLFGNISMQPVLNVRKTAAPPKTSGTLRSIKGSIFGSRSSRSRPPTRQPSAAAMSEKSTLAERPATSATGTSIAPTIQVTGEDGQMGRQPSSGTRHRSLSRRRNSLQKKDRSGSLRTRRSAGGLSNEAQIADGEPFPPTATDPEQTDFFAHANRRTVSSASSTGRERTLRPLNSYLSSNSKSTEFSEISVEATHVSMDLLPLVQLSKDQQKTHRTNILIRVWLMIAGIYRRAGLYDDCKGAIAEAQKLAQGLETELTRDPSGAGVVREAGWAEKKSIQDLLGDISSELGLLSLAKDTPYTAREEFESALTHSPDHPASIVGLSNILLDIYSEKLLPTPGIPPLDIVESPSTPVPNVSEATGHNNLGALPYTPLGLRTTPAPPAPAPVHVQTITPPRNDELPAPYKAACLPLADRLAARDRAYALLSGLTRLGSGWNYSEAWFALARAYEESGQPDKAKEVLWWCVELEEAMGVREWRCLGGGGYII